MSQEDVKNELDRQYTGRIQQLESQYIAKIQQLEIDFQNQRIMHEDKLEYIESALQDTVRCLNDTAIVKCGIMSNEKLTFEMQVSDFIGLFSQFYMRIHYQSRFHTFEGYIDGSLL